MCGFADSRGRCPGWLRILGPSRLGVGHRRLASDAIDGEFEHAGSRVVTRGTNVVSCAPHHIEGKVARQPTPSADGRDVDDDVRWEQIHLRSDRCKRVADRGRHRTDGAPNSWAAVRSVSIRCSRSYRRDNAKVTALDRDRLEAAIAAQESLRGTVADEIVDAAIAGLQAQLGAHPTGRRRRQATVLFADISGFTRMAESMDAEDLTVLMDALWSTLDQVVAEHGGRIDKHIGDALMAVWGAAATQEDDPEQGVRAALRLHEALDRFRAKTDIDLSMRIGVNTGPVMIGSIGSSGEFTAMGDTVNVASRLEHAAPTNGVLISHDTYRHVRGVFDVLALPALAVRGKSEPLRVYEVRAEKSRAFRVRPRDVEGIETSMVGRTDEFQILLDAFGRSRELPEVVVVEIRGEAGVGKSRLLWEFENWLEVQPVPTFFLSGRALAQRSAAPLALVRDIVANRFEILDSDNSREVVSKLAAGTAPTLDTQDAAVLAAWLGYGLQDLAELPLIPDDEQLAQIGRAHLVAIMRSFAEESPMVVLIEDQHWADDASMEALNHVVDALHGLPLLVVVTSRPSPRIASITWSSDEKPVRISLEPLSGPESQRLIEEILEPAGSIPRSLVDFVTARAEGSPFFVEELIKMMIDDGAIDVDHEPWTIDLSDTAFDRVPSTLTGVLQARLDALPESTRQGLQNASVVGRIFWDDAVHQLGGDLSSLRPAIDREFVFERRPSSLSGCSEYVFKHAMLHEVVYETVLLEQRRALHAEAARWLEQTSGSRRDEYLIEIAGHWERGGSPERAAELLDSAAELAFRAGDPKGCLELFDRATHLHRESGIPIPPTTLVRAGTARSQLGDLDNAQVLIADALSAAEAARDDQQLSRALLAAADIARRLGSVERADELLDRAGETAERLGGRELGELLVQRITRDVRLSRTPRPELIERVLRLAAEIDDPNFEARAHLALGRAAGPRNDFELAIHHVEQALAISRRCGDRIAEATALMNLGANLHMWGDATGDTSLYARAEHRYLEALERCERLGLREAQALTTTNLAQLKLRLGEVEEAARLARRGLALAHRIHALTWVLTALLVHAETLIEEGNRKTGVALIGLVRSHPASDADETRRVLERVGDDPETVELLESGIQLDLNSVIDEVIRLDGGDPDWRR